MNYFVCIYKQWRNLSRTQIKHFSHSFYAPFKIFLAVFTINILVSNIWLIPIYIFSSKNTINNYLIANEQARIVRQLQRTFYYYPEIMLSNCSYQISIQVFCFMNKQNTSRDLQCFYLKTCLYVFIILFRFFLN